MGKEGGQKGVDDGISWEPRSGPEAIYILCALRELNQSVLLPALCRFQSELQYKGLEKGVWM